MWAAPPLRPPVPAPPTTIPTTKPPLRRRFVAVYSFQNREEMGQAVIATTFKTSEPRNQKFNRKVPEKKELGELSGADILMAIGKAAAQKAEKKMKKKKEMKKVSTSGKNQGNRDFSKVRPLCIKPEWSDRLQELEKRLEEIVHM